GQELGKLIAHKNLFTYYEGIADSTLVEKQNWIFRIVVDETGAVWLRTFGNGLFRLDPRTRKDIWYPGGFGIIPGLLKNGRRTMWVNGSQSIDRYDEKTGRFTSFMKRDTLVLLLEGRDGSLWFGTGRDQSHLVRLDRATGTLLHYPRNSSDSAFVKDNCIMTLCEDREGIIWCGSCLGGMSRFDPRTGEYRRYVASPGDSNSLRNNTVTSILQGEQNRLWIGTNRGLQSFDPASERFTAYPWPEREEDLFIRGMADDGVGNLWLTGSGKRLVCFTKATGTFRTFGPDRGFFLEQTAGIGFDEGSRTMYVGGLNGLKGLASFSPDSLLLADNPDVPRIAITGFNIFGEPAALPSSITSTREIVLPHSDNYLSFTFAVLDFLNPSANRYAYKLEGVDRDWVKAFERRYANYTNLEPGEYVFHVKGSNSAGIWNEAGTSLRIVITPPWWRTVWAYVGYGAAIVLMLYGMRRYDRKRALLKHQLEMKDFEAEKLREVDAMKMRFFANISHEFRTPLTLILGPVGKLLSRAQRADDQEDLHIIRRNGLRLLELINQLLDIAKLDAGRMKIQVQALDLVPYLKGLVFSFASLAERKHIQLEFQPTEESITAYVDRDKVQKIVTNLLYNAFKFTPEGGEIRVGVSLAGGAIESGLDQEHPETTGGFVEIVVSDNGVGIPMEKLEKIFHRFYQADDSHVREHEGTGIGLALTKELVEVHHGHISVTSEPGKGSTFRVRLPLGKEHWQEEEIVEDTESAEERAVAVPVSVVDVSGGEEAKAMKDGNDEPEDTTGDARPLVLVVEDNADVRSYIRSYLTQQYRVEEAVDGLAGLETAIDHMPDLVVSDIMMPKMDGVELCRKLKTDERTSHIPVILLTARASDEGKLEGLETGADDYIIKPFDVQELQVRIKNLIELRKTLREKYRRHCVLEPQDTPIESMDEKFLRKVLDVVQEQMSEPGFSTTTLAQGVCMSRMQLNRKLHALTGRSPHDFIRNLRLQRAAKLLDAHWGNVAEIAFEVGFNSLSHFSKAFREEYGVLPSEYGAQHAQGSHR
ncbi:MAG: ATP-binding protein, partial [Ignavibacteria bacterium]|nr:ATP-binding protein [Ignavibacteria bacterium]